MRRLLLAAMVAACAPTGPLAADLPAGQGGPALLDISQGWRYQVSRPGETTDGIWAGPDLDDASWRRDHVSHARTGEVPGGREIWYRKWVELKRAWPRVFLALSGVAGRADVFVNGKLAAENLTRPHQGTTQMVREITAAVGSSTRFLLAVKLSSGEEGREPGFDPGMGTPVLLARGARGLFVEREGWLDYMAQEFPELPWPSWARGEGSGWVPVGPPYGAGAAMSMGRRGQLEPAGRGFAVSTWLYYPARKRLYCLETISSQLSLEGRYLPLPRISGKAGRWFNVFVRCWVHGFPDHEQLQVGMGEVTVENTLDRTRELDLIVAVHPFGPSYPPHTIERVDYDADARVIRVNGRPAIVLRGAPDLFCATGFSESGGTIARLMARGEFTSSSSALDTRYGLASGAAVYRFRIQPYGARTQTFRILPGNAPERLDSGLVERVRGIRRKKSWQAARGLWQKALLSRGRMVLRIPDKRAQEGFYASIGYLLMSAPREGSSGLSSLVRSALFRVGCGGTAADLAVPLTLTVSGETPDALSGTDFAGSGEQEEWLFDGFYRPGMALRQARLLLARGDEEAVTRIMDWCLSNQTPAGSYAWAEAVEPDTGGHGDGPLPDSRAAAHYVCLVRDMMLAERDRKLAITPAIPSDWVKPGRTVQVRYAPTGFGVIPGFSVISSPRELTLRVYSLEQVARLERRRTPAEIEAAHPPEGYLWRIPGSRRMSRIIVDGRLSKEPPDGRWVKLPAAVRSAKVVW